MTIKEVSKITGLTASTLRYYEQIGVVPTISRTSSGTRNYSQLNIDWIESIIKLTDAGMSLSSIVEYVSLANLGDDTIYARKILLEQEQARLMEKLNIIQTSLDLINYKINEYYVEVVPKTAEIINREKQKSDGRLSPF